MTTAGKVPERDLGFPSGVPSWFRPEPDLKIPGSAGLELEPGVPLGTSSMSWTDPDTLAIWHWFPGPELTGGDLPSGWVYFASGASWVDVIRHDPDLLHDVAEDDLAGAAAQRLGRQDIALTQATTELGRSRRGWYRLPVIIVRVAGHYASAAAAEAGTIRE